MSLDPRVAIRSLEILSKQIDELEDRNRDLAGAVNVLATAIRDIETIATNQFTLLDVNSIIHVCGAGGVRTAMEMA